MYCIKIAIMQILIKKIRKELGLSQPQFAEKVGMSLQYLRDLEHNRYTPSLQMLDKIAKALNISINNLITD